MFSVRATPNLCRLRKQTTEHRLSSGVRCVATDGPTIGGVDPRRALMTYWALGTKGMVAVEFLIGAAAIPQNAYFLFAAIKIRGSHGSPGRAICLY